MITELSYNAPLDHHLYLVCPSSLLELNRTEQNRAQLHVLVQTKISRNNTLFAVLKNSNQILETFETVSH